jgi:hypothetical protein
MTTPTRVAALYHFTRFDDPDALQAPLHAACDHARITVQFHGADQSMRHPPERRVPRNEDRQQDRAGDEVRIARSPVLALVRENR